MNFIIGAVTGVIMVICYWTVLGISDWLDMRPARRLRRDADKQP